MHVNAHLIRPCYTCRVKREEGTHEHAREHSHIQAYLTLLPDSLPSGYARRHMPSSRKDFAATSTAPSAQGLDVWFT